MNLNTIAEVKRPASADQITEWRDGYAWLAGGTWLFSEPQVSTDTLIDLERLNWPALESSPAGLDIAYGFRFAHETLFAAQMRCSIRAREGSHCGPPALSACCHAQACRFLARGRAASQNSTGSPARRNGARHRSCASAATRFWLRSRSGERSSRQQ